MKKLKIHFGFKCDFITQRFYLFMTDNINAKRIYFKEFIDIMYRTIFNDSNTYEQMKFPFFVIDHDHNKKLNGPDLLTTQENVEPSSEFAAEIQIVVDFFVRTHLLVKD